MSRERDEQIARVVFQRILGRDWPPPKGLGRAIFEDAVRQVADAHYAPDDRDQAIVTNAAAILLGPPGNRYPYRGPSMLTALGRCEPKSVIAEVNKLFPPDEPSFAVNDVVVMEPIAEPPSGWTRILNSHYPAAGALGGGAIGAELHHGLSGAIVGVLAGWIIGIYAAWKS